jgi:hypothetical protein
MVETMKEKLWTWLAYHLPKSLVYWAAVRVFADVSCHELSSHEVARITVLEVMKAWGERK